MNAPARIDMVLDSEDLTAAEAALLDFCDPVALDPATSAKLAKLGVEWLDDLYVAPVCFGGDRLEFARDLGVDIATWRRAVVAVIIPVRDESDAAFDLVALDLKAGAIAIWRGGVPLLGDLGPWRLGDGIHVYPTVLDWLRAERDGLVILDASEARWMLVDEDLIVDDAEFGDRLEAAMRLPKPKVFVRNKRAA